jgi:hypothetical protein
MNELIKKQQLIEEQLKEVISRQEKTENDMWNMHKRQNLHEEKMTDLEASVHVVDKRTIELSEQIKRQQLSWSRLTPIFFLLWVIVLILLFS